LPSLKAPLKAVILVGGPGTRLQPLTYDLPKPMMPVLNRPFMEHTIAYLKRADVRDIILTLNYLPEVIQSHFGDGQGFGVHLAYCVEKDPLGTAGAVKNAEKYLDSTFLVLNGDVFTDLDIKDMLASHRGEKARVTISLQWVDNPSAFGVVETDDSGRVRRFVEKPPPGQATTNWINAGTYILEPEVLKYIPVNSHYMFERGLFPLLLGRGEKVFGYPFSGYWLDMGTPAKYLSLNRDLLLARTKSPIIGHPNKNGIYLGQDVTIHPTAEVVAPVMIGPGGQIGRGVHIKGPVVIGPGSCIEDSATIEDAVLWDHVHVGTNTIIRQCIIGGNTIIEPCKQITDCVVTSSQVVALSR